jgi:hypothetical protein
MSYSNRNKHNKKHHTNRQQQCTTSAPPIVERNTLKRHTVSQARVQTHAQSDNTQVQATHTTASQSQCTECDCLQARIQELEAQNKRLQDQLNNLQQRLNDKLPNLINIEPSRPQYQGKPTRDVKDKKEVKKRTKYSWLLLHSIHYGDIEGGMAKLFSAHPTEMANALNIALSNNTPLRKVLSEKCTLLKQKDAETALKLIRFTNISKADYRFLRILDANWPPYDMVLAYQKTVPMPTIISVEGTHGGIVKNVAEVILLEYFNALKLSAQPNGIDLVRFPKTPQFDEFLWKHKIDNQSVITLFVRIESDELRTAHAQSSYGLQLSLLFNLDYVNSPCNQALLGFWLSEKNCWFET